eukprot:scaffold33443_cov54-Attheya_sp.AAC.1
MTRQRSSSLSCGGVAAMVWFAVFLVVWSNLNAVIPVHVHAFAFAGFNSHRYFGNFNNHRGPSWRQRDPVQGLSSRVDLSSSRMTPNDDGIETVRNSGKGWRGMVQQKMQQAMALTQQNNTNNKNGTAACEAWSEFFAFVSCSQLALLYKDTPVVVALCLTLYGSTLSGTGNDRLAVDIFSQARTFIHTKKDDTVSDNWELVYRIGMGRGLALQRLLRYSEARDEFCDLLSSSSSSSTLLVEIKTSESNRQDVEQMVMGAVVCSMRLGDLPGAIQILEQLEQNVDEDKDGGKWMSHYRELSGLLGILLFLRSMNEDESSLPTHSNSPSSSSEMQRIVSLLETASSSVLSEGEGSILVSPLYAWVLDHCVLDSKTKESIRPDMRGGAWDTMGDSSLSWAAMNTGPFDDPGLLYLDDKVLLHRLLTTTKKESSSSPFVVVENHDDDAVSVDSFWPTSYILPEDVVHFQQHATAVEDSTLSKRQQQQQQQESVSKPWILKERAGYGSHGNSLATTEDVIRYCDDKNSSLLWNKEEELLCQTVIDPPLLIDGRKCSLRVYVIYFLDEKNDTSTMTTNSQSSPAGCSIYLCNEGLVKLAALPYNSSSGNNENDVQMTNSGRGRGRGRGVGSDDEKTNDDNDDMATQYDFRYLKKELEARGWDYENDLWNGIRSSVCTVMGQYQTKLRQDEDATTSSSSASVMRWKLARLGLPKILGLDFVLEEKHHPERCIVPWLLEVNRFPGLEPRGSSDSFVKQTVVVQDAWRCAAKRRLGKTGDISLDIASLEYLEL